MMGRHDHGEDTDKISKTKYCTVYTRIYDYTAKDEGRQKLNNGGGASDDDDTYNSVYGIRFIRWRRAKI